MEDNNPSNTNEFVHDEGLDRLSLEDESKKKLRRFIDDAELTIEQQEQLRQVSAHYAVRTAPVPEENIGMRDRCLKEAIIQSDLPAYDAQAIENRGVSFGIAEGSKAVVYVNDSPLTQAQLEGAYQFISTPDETDLEAVRIAFEKKQTEALEAAYSAPSYEDVRRPIEMQPAIDTPHTLGAELKPITAQITAQAVKITKKIFEIVGAR
jgi:hypothetical protein